MRITNPSIPFGYVVAVVGANGYMAIETCEKLLEAGYRVRGTVRDVERHREWMHKLFDERWPGRLEVVEVSDFQAPGAFDKAFEGVSGVIYPSMPTIFDLEPANVIEPMVKGVINSLASSARAGVKRYVLSSSSKAVTTVEYGKEPLDLTVDTFNHEAIAEASKASQDRSFDRMVDIYSAGRTSAELAFWAWIKEHNPPFVANCVVPDGQFGRVLDLKHMNTSSASSSGQLKNALHGDWEKIGLQLAFFTDVQDSARLLVAALALDSIRQERIFSYCYNRTWNDVRHKVQELFPQRPDLVRGNDQDLPGRDLSYAPGPIARAEEILREIGRPGYAAEEEILQDFVKSMMT